jgi:hypothetical protein
MSRSPTLTEITSDPHHQAALAVLGELHLRAADRQRGLISGHRTSLPIIAEGQGGRQFLLKYYLPSPPDAVLPAGARPDDYARREVGFYRLLDSIDPERRDFRPRARSCVGPGDPAGLDPARMAARRRGPDRRSHRPGSRRELLQRLARLPTERLLGRRSFPLEHWDPIGYLDRIRAMYDAVLFVLGEARWRHVQRFFAEAVRWTDGRKQVLVHGDFTRATSS